MVTNPLSEVEKILFRAEQTIHQIEQKTKQKNIPKESLTHLISNLNMDLNRSLHDLENIKLGSIRLTPELKDRVNRVLMMISSLNHNRQIIEASGQALQPILKRLESILKNFRIGEKVEKVDQGGV